VTTRIAWALLLGFVLAGCDGVAAEDAGSGADAATCASREDSTPCGATSICVGGSCVESTCGDGVIDARTESCDDGNQVAFDGCEPGSCMSTCMNDSQCDDGNVCNGLERCNLAEHVCTPGVAPEERCLSAPGSVRAIGGVRQGNAIRVTNERFEGFGNQCAGSICATGSIEP
jgi:cysteine-rich repeat protein